MAPAELAMLQQLVQGQQQLQALGATPQAPAPHSPPGFAEMLAAILQSWQSQRAQPAHFQQLGIRG